MASNRALLLQVALAHDLTSDESSDGSSDEEITSDGSDAGLESDFGDNPGADGDGGSYDEWQITGPGTDAKLNAEIEFIATCGIHPSLTPPANIEENTDWFVKLVLSDELIEKLCDWTNRRAWLEWEKLHAEGTELQERNRRSKACTCRSRTSALTNP